MAWCSIWFCTWNLSLYGILWVLLGFYMAVRKANMEGCGMSDIYLKEANMADLEQEWLFVRDMPEDENGLTNSWPDVSREDFESKALPEMIRFAKGEDLPAGYVPETFLFLWEADQIVGQFRIRHYLTDSLREGAGHIGYYIAKDCRGRGLGTIGLSLTLNSARHIVREREFYLRVNRDNQASLHVMLKNGGRVVHEDSEKYYVRIPNPGKDAANHSLKVSGK